MWGSKLPPLFPSWRGTATRSAIWKEHLDSFCSAADKEWIFGKNGLGDLSFSANWLIQSVELDFFALGRLLFQGFEIDVTTDDSGCIGAALFCSARLGGESLLPAYGSG